MKDIRDLLGENLSDVKHSLKSDEEINQYIVDPELSEVDKAAQLWASGRAQQMEYVQSNLARIVRTDPAGMILDTGTADPAGIKWKADWRRPGQLRRSS